MVCAIKQIPAAELVRCRNAVWESRGVWLRVLTHGNLQSRAISSSICRSSVAQLVTKRTMDSSSPRGPHTSKDAYWLSRSISWFGSTKNCWLVGESI